MLTRQFKDEDFLGLLNATTYRDLCVVAKRSLVRLHPPILQVCGPMTTGGLGPEKNSILFWWTIHRLIVNLGYTTFNQMIFQDAMWHIIKKNPSHGYDWSLIDQFYYPLFQEKLIQIAVFLPGWETSKGATREHDFCREFSIDVLYLPKEFPHISDEVLRQIVEKKIQEWCGKQVEYP